MNIEDATIEQLEEEINKRKDFESKNIFLKLINILGEANKKGIKIFNYECDSVIKEFIYDHGVIYYIEEEV